MKCSRKSCASGSSTPLRRTTPSRWSTPTSTSTTKTTPSSQVGVLKRWTNHLSDCFAAVYIDWKIARLRQCKGQRNYLSPWIQTRKLSHSLILLGSCIDDKRKVQKIDGQQTFFVVPACHYLVQDGFEQLLSFLHCPLWLKECAVHKSQQHRRFLRGKTSRKNFGNAENRTRAAGWEARWATNFIDSQEITS